MPLVVPPGYGSAAWVLESNSGTQPFVFTMGVGLSEYAGDPVAAANKLFDCWLGELQPLTYDELSLDRVVLTVGQDGPGGSVESDRPSAAGLASGNPACLAMSTLVRKSTAQLGRRGRGRMFVPGLISETEIDESGNLDGPTLLAIQDAMNQFASLIVTDNAAGAPINLVLLHSSAPTLPTPITSLVVQEKVGILSQRIK